MKDISWILLSIGLAMLVILLIKPLWKNKRKHSKIKINNKFVINDTQYSKQTSNKIITLRFSPKVKSNIPFDEVFTLFKNNHLSFNNMQIFEKKDGNKILFNVANLIEPGTLEKNKDIPGFTFFFQTSDPKTDLIALNQMFETMQKIRTNYDAWILDENGKNIHRSDLNKLLTFNE